MLLSEKKITCEATWFVGKHGFAFDNYTSETLIYQYAAFTCIADSFNQN